MANEIQQCAECVQLLGDYLEGALAKDRAEALERHLSLCMPCITFVRTYKATSRICRQALAADMPAELVSSLEQFLGKSIPGFPCGGREGGCGKTKDPSEKKN